MQPKDQASVAFVYLKALDEHELVMISVPTFYCQEASLDFDTIAVKVNLRFLIIIVPLQHTLSS